MELNGFLKDRQGFLFIIRKRVFEFILFLIIIFNVVVIHLSMIDHFSTLIQL